MARIKFILAISFLVLSGCFCSVPLLSRPTTPPPQPGAPSPEEELFLTYLNLDKMPDTITDFQGEGEDTFPVLTSTGYFNYQAASSYIDMLKKYDRFIEKSESNELIHEVRCTDHNFPHDFSWWTDDPIDITGKTCLKGIFFPYVHYILYDPRSGHIIHFVTGMQD